MVAALPPYVATIERVTAAELPASWRRGCPVAPAQLRRVRLRYYGLDGKPHIGRVVVRDRVARDVAAIFGDLYRARFPIRKIRVIDVYGGSDARSVEDDNTSGFNCRYAIAPGAEHWSMHAYGEAIDVNPVENPHVQGGRVSHANGRPYVDRSRVRPGMALAGGVLVRTFAKSGWKWGGAWSGSLDYQHFSLTGS